jgi:hypothetical protein
VANSPRRARVGAFRVSENAADSVLLAEFRNAFPPGTDLENFADLLAENLAARGPVSRATCAALARAAANLQALTLCGYAAPEILAVLGVTAAKLEMKATP